MKGVKKGSYRNRLTKSACRQSERPHAPELQARARSTEYKSTELLPTKKALVFSLPNQNVIGGEDPGTWGTAYNGGGMAGQERRQTHQRSRSERMERGKWGLASAEPFSKPLKIHSVDWR